MEKIVILPALESKLFDLVLTLYDNEYFGFVENALTYVDKIVDFMYTIPALRHKKPKIINTVPIIAVINPTVPLHGLFVLILKMIPI
jgi:hypothetical protein